MMKSMRLFAVRTKLTNNTSVFQYRQRFWYSSSPPLHLQQNVQVTDEAKVDLKHYGGYQSFKEKLRKIGDGEVFLDIKNSDNSSSYAVITFSNPKKKNALSGKMMAELADAIERLDKILNDLKSTHLRAVILKGDGGSFCSGSDLDDIRQHVSSPLAGGNMSKFMHEGLLRLKTMNIFSVAAIDGAALGGGSELAALCDYRVMHKDAKLGFVQATLGVSPGWGGATWLQEIVGPRRAADILARSERYTALEALKEGLVDRVVTFDSIMEEECIELLKEKRCVGDKDCAAAIRATKNLAYGSEEIKERLKKQLNFEQTVFESLWASEFHLDAIRPKPKRTQTKD